MRLEKNRLGPSILQPTIERFGWARTLAACESALGFPPEMVTTINEVRKVCHEIGNGNQ